MILQVDSDWDDATHIGHEFRTRKYVLPHFEESFIVTKLFGSSAKRNFFQNEVQQKDIYYVSGLGHGEYDKFTGHDYETLWQVSQNIPTEEVSDKIIHLLSCQTGKELGVELINKGAKAFFGYTENFKFMIDSSHTGDIIDDPSCDPFFKADSEIDRCIVNGLTALETHDRTMKLYNDLFDEWLERDPILASRLNWDQTYFCSPVIDEKWGSKEAHLEDVFLIIASMGLG